MVDQKRDVTFLPPEQVDLAIPELCQCGTKEIMNHTVDEYQITKYESRLLGLHEADENAVDWLNDKSAREMKYNKQAGWTSCCAINSNKELKSNSGWGQVPLSEKSRLNA